MDRFRVLAFLIFTACAVVAAFWLFNQQGYEPLIALLTSIAGQVGIGTHLAIRSSIPLKDPEERSSEWRRSPLTPDSPLLNSLVKGAIETVCRGVSLPRLPEEAQLRVFIFRKEGNSLVCSHFWSANPTTEKVGVNRFDINSDLAAKVAVVRAVLDRKTVGMGVNPLDETESGVRGDVAEINFVLAAPILKTDKSIWGVVDFDSSNEAGRTLLMNKASESVLYQLAEHIKLLLELAEEDAGSGRLVG